MAQEETGKKKIITIVASTDIHGHYLPWNYALDQADQTGSLSQISTLIKEIRAENPHTLVLEVGDLIQDNSAQLFKDDDPHPAVLALNEIGYDAWTVGNHEFDYGFETLDRIVAQFEGVFLGGNVYRQDGSRYYSAYHIFEMAGVKIGVIGMTSPLVAEFNAENDIFTGKEVRSPVAEAKKAVKELAGKVDVLIGLLHMGIDNENQVPDSGAADLVAALPEFDAVFTGHMHSLKLEEINDVFLIQANAYGSHLARLDLTFEEIEGELQLVDKEAGNIPLAGYGSDSKLEAQLQSFHERARADANIVLGKIVGMDMVPPDEIKGIPQVQIQETTLTNFFSEVMLFYSDADVVAHQIDTDTARLDEGPVRKKDLAHNYQYVNGEISVFKVTGQDLKDYMEWSAAYFNQSQFGDLTISFDPERRASKYSTHDIFGGVNYQIDLRQEVGQRIQDLTYLNGVPIKMTDELLLGMNGYRMRYLISEDGPLAGREFWPISSSQWASAYGEIEGRIRNLAARYLKEEMNGVYYPQLHHHWEIVGIDYDHPAREAIVSLVNQGIVEIPANAQGQTNITSINILDSVTQEEVKAVAEKANLNPAFFENCETRGDFYIELSRQIKRDPE